MEEECGEYNAELEDKRRVVTKNVYPSLDDYESGEGFPFPVKLNHSLRDYWEYNPDGMNFDF